MILLLYRNKSKYTELLGPKCLKTNLVTLYLSLPEMPFLEVMQYWYYDICHSHIDYRLAHSVTL